MHREQNWAAIDAERGALAADLAGIGVTRWATPSLCSELTVRQVLAHMTVSGAVSGRQWFAGVVRARFDFDRQVLDRLSAQLGANADETLARFRATIGSRISPPLPGRALLGEMVVHAEDIRRPLGIVRDYPAATLSTLLDYYAGTDQVVVARKRIRGLRLEATDGDVVVGTGDLVQGRMIALIMAMTGRGAFAHELTGPGAAVLAERCS